jgi:hypothetical protein
MMRVEEFRARGTFPRPLAGEAIQAGLIKPDGATRCVPRLQDTVVNHAAEKKSHHDERERNSHKKGEHPANKQSQQQNRGEQNAQTAKVAVALLVKLFSLKPADQAGLVFRLRIHESH